MNDAVLPNDTTVGSDVLDFYRKLPFNYYGSNEDKAAQIRKAPGVKPFMVLEDLLRRPIRVLDIGCGTGVLSNTIQYHYPPDVTGIDFNPVAVAKAGELAEILGISTQFEVADLFTYQSDEPYDMACSIGVLHHTYDCLGALRLIFRRHIRQHGYFFGGLYHKFGRAPFLEYFNSLKNRGLSEGELFEEFRSHLSGMKDQEQLYSWFRDQVLHPHETQHSLQEIMKVANEEHMDLIATSINRFETVEDLVAVYDVESSYRDLGYKRLKEKKYFPGFFTFLLKKKY